jgi:hypothetical protein
MKRLTFFALLLALLVCGASAQILDQATVEVININPDVNDPFLCVFGNTIEDVALIFSFSGINDILKGKTVQYLRERQEMPNLHPLFTREMERLRANFLSLHKVSYGFEMVNGNIEGTWYLYVDIIERIGNRYYRVATNNY